MSLSPKDDFGDRMKQYEGQESQRRFTPLLPICIRVDGKNFSKWTRRMKRPYDERMSGLMMFTTAFLMTETNAVIGYTQSDEISLILYSGDFRSQVYFDGKIQKIVSVISSLCTAFFNEHARSELREEYPGLATFDCRAWVVPNLEEAANTILWREKDATKNSISMAARTFYSHKQLYLKTGAEMQEMMFQKGQNWNDYPAFFKRGTFFRKTKTTRVMTEDELEKIKEPFRSAVRNKPIERSGIEKIDMPPFTKVINRVGVIFNQEAPITEMNQ